MIAIKKMRTVEVEADVVSNDLVEYCAPNIARLWMTARWIEVATCMMKRKCRPRAPGANGLKNKTKPLSAGPFPLPRGPQGQTGRSPLSEKNEILPRSQNSFVWL